MQGAGANVIAMPDADGVVMVDGGLASHSAGLLDAMRRETGAEVRTLFNTHWHPEQTGSNVPLGKAGATIIAHENTRLWLTTDVTWPWAPEHTFPPLPPEGQPNQTFYTEGELDSARGAIRYGYLPKAHTDGDIYVHFERANVLAAGGAVTGKGWAFIDWWTGAWIGGLVDAQAKLLEIADAQTLIVPADGPVVDRAELEAQHEMYATVYERLRDLLRSGRSPDEAIAAEPTKEFDAKMGDPREFVRRAFESLWGPMSPDA